MIAVKLVASALVLGTTIGLARMAGMPFRVRVRTLEQWQQLLRHLGPLIEWRRTPLPQALEEAGKGLSHLGGAMTQFIAQMGQRDADFTEAWGMLLSRQAGLWEEDRAVLTDLGRVLGMSDVSYQHDHLLATHHELERLCSEARMRLDKDARMIVALVGAAGVMVVMMML